MDLALEFCRRSSLIQSHPRIRELRDVDLIGSHLVALPVLRDSNSIKSCQNNCEQSTKCGVAAGSGSPLIPFKPTDLRWARLHGLHGLEVNPKWTGLSWQNPTQSQSHQISIFLPVSPVKPKRWRVVSCQRIGNQVWSRQRSPNL